MIIAEGRWYCYIQDMSKLEKQGLKEALTWVDYNGNKKFLLGYDKDSQIFYFSRKLKPYLVKEYGFDFVVDDEEGKPVVKSIKVDAKVLKGIELFPHQVKCIKQALKQKEGILRASTGSGKSEISLGFYQNLRQKQLIIVPSTYLKNEFYQRAVDYGIPESEIGLVSGDEKYDGNLVIAISDSLNAGVKKNNELIMSILENTKAVFVDECHRAGSPTVSKILKTCINAEYMIGLSATPFDTDNPLDSYKDARVASSLGSIIMDVPYAYLVEQGIVAQSYVFFKKMAGKPRFYKCSPLKLMDKEIAQNDTRNAVITHYATKALDYGMKPFISVGLHSHAEKLMKRFKDTPYKVLVKFGGSDGLEFDEHRQITQIKTSTKWAKEFNDGRWDIIIGTPTLDEGVDAGNLNFVILGASGKSPKLNLQRMGRGTRKKKSGKNIMLLVDFIDNNHVFLKSWSNKRYEIFQNNGCIFVKDEQELWRRVKEIGKDV